MKRLISFLLILLICLALTVACKEDKTDGEEGITSENIEETTTIVTTEEKKFEFVARSDNSKLREGEYVTISSVDSKYVKSKTSTETFLSYETPQFEIGGVKDPSDNGRQLYRLDYSKRTSYRDLTQSKISQLYATHTSGVTLRFRTNSPSIIIKATLKNVINNQQIVGNRGEYGFDVYVGSGTAREYCGGRMQFLTSSSLNDTVTLPGGYVEVLINFPLHAGISDFSIGFPNANSKIAAPLERDNAPIVFYGSDSVQGIGASRPGTAYTNLVCRMLNTDCINQGYVGGAYGEQIIADYISGLDMSAFVMDYDRDADIETLKATHYNFYNTIRNAKPDIPIVLVSRVIFTTEPTAEDIERANIIKGTYEKAIENGDENVYFIDGDFIFPTDRIVDLCSADMIHLNDTGMYYMAMSVYDVLYNAFNKASK